MFGEISVMAWMGAAIMLAIGGGAGFFVARQIKDKRTLELEQQLEATQSKLTEYQSDVNRHFLKTSLLFNKLTDNYREVYEHLATGAQKLCNEKPLTTALDLPEAKILSAAIATDASATISVDEKQETDAIIPMHSETEHDDATHLGAESIVATEEIITANTETTPAENTESPTPVVAEQATAEQSSTETEITEPAIAEPVIVKETAAAQSADDIPTISEEELKALEASEKEKEHGEDVHLGAESTPGVELEHHKTHPSIH